MYYGAVWCLDKKALQPEIKQFQNSAKISLSLSLNSRRVYTNNIFLFIKKRVN